MKEQPACFSSPVAVSATCSTCQSCAHSSACAKGALEFLDDQPDSPLMQRERLRLAVVSRALAATPDGQDIPTPTPVRPGRLPISADQRTTLSQLAAPVATMAKKLFERGWFDFAKREMVAGRNPGANEWQRILCRHLIGRGVSRKDLQMEYQQRLQLTEGTAKVRVSRAVSLFAAGGLITEFDSRVQLRRN